MTQVDDQEDRARKERSPSYPFISLPKAIERARAFSDSHRRNPARLAMVAETWGYAPSSSGLLQTAAALKAYGLLEDLGRGADRKVQLTDLAQKILHDTRPGMKEMAVKEAAVRPRLFAEYADKWLPSRPSDSHCLSELTLDRGFTEAAAKMFLRSFDETVDFASLKEDDALSFSHEESGMAQEVAPAETAPATFFRQGSLPRGFAGGGGAPSSIPRATLPLPEGTAALEIPTDLSPKSYAALKSWVELMVSLAEPSIE